MQRRWEGRGEPVETGSWTWRLMGLTVDSKKLEYGFRVIYAGFPSVFGLGFEGSHI